MSLTLPKRSGLEAGRRPGGQDGAPAVTGRSGLEVDQRRWGLALSLPAIIYFLVFWVYPAIVQVHYSFTDYDFVGSAEWVGLDNYRYLLEDPAFSHSVWVTILFSLGTIVPTIVLALLIAVPLARPGRGSAVLRTLLFIPAVMPLVASSFLWRGMYAREGLVNRLLGWVGVDGRAWLSDPDVALWALIVMVIWKSLGLYMVLLIAGLQALPENVYHAAALDGAGSLRTFFQVTLPMMRKTLLFVVVIATIASMQSFVPAFLLTGGGPAEATEVLPIYLYRNAFAFTDVGLASAVSVVLFVALLVLSLGQFSIFRLGDRR